MSGIPMRRRVGPTLMIAVLMLGAACSRQPSGADIVYGIPEGVDLELRSLALREVRTLQTPGQARLVRALRPQRLGRRDPR